MKISHAVALLAMLAACPSAAQDQIRETPAIGKITTAAIGATIWEQYQFEGVPGVVIEGPSRQTGARSRM